MANLCNNDLQIEGPESALQEFYELAQGLGGEGEPCLLDFRQHVPVSAPEAEADGSANEGAWGTYALLCARDIQYDGDPAKGGLSYQFTSRNSPPEQWLRAVGALHHQCRFNLIYGEGGCCYAGELIVDGGAVFRDDHYSDEDAVAFLRERELAWMVGIFDVELDDE